MTYLSFRTAAKHALVIKAKRQRSLFWLINDALAAEPRLDEKELSYRNYRLKRGLRAVEADSSIRMSWSARKDLDRVTDRAFRNLDKGILRIALQPKTPSSRHKALRWFRGDLRRVVVEPFPVFYTVLKERVKVLRIGYPRWDNVSGSPRKFIIPVASAVSANRKLSSRRG